MPDDLNKRMDESLREYAAKRREGAEFEVHPATRKLLRDEVKRVYGGDAPARQRGSWIAMFWPHLAASMAVALFLGVSLLIFLPKDQPQMARTASPGKALKDVADSQVEQIAQEKKELATAEDTAGARGRKLDALNAPSQEPGESLVEERVKLKSAQEEPALLKAKATLEDERTRDQLSDVKRYAAEANVLREEERLQERAGRFLQPELVNEPRPTTELNPRPVPGPVRAPEATPALTQQPRSEAGKDLLVIEETAAPPALQEPNRAETPAPANKGQLGVVLQDAEQSTTPESFGLAAAKQPTFLTTTATAPAEADADLRFAPARPATRAYGPAAGTGPNEAAKIEELGAALRRDFVALTNGVGGAGGAGIAGATNTQWFAAFEMEQLGEQVRFTDTSGATFVGSLFAKTPDFFELGQQVMTNRFARSATPAVSSEGTRLYYFKTTSQNLTLGKQAIFEGDFYDPTNKFERPAAALSRARGVVTRRVIVPTIVGRVILDETNSVPVQAVAPNP